MKKSNFYLLAILIFLFVGCDKINRASRTMDTMLGGDYEVHVLGHKQPYIVNGGKVTSVPEKGYYVFYPLINGKEKMVQSPIQITTIIKTD